MSNAKIVDQTHLVDEQPILLFHIGLISILFLCMISDGYDLQAMSFAAPVVVDHDIDPSNIHDVIWAMSTRCDPPNDIDYIRRHWSTPLDPLLFEPPWENNRAVVDACRPWGKLAKFPPVAEASPELKEKVAAKWPHLFQRPA